MQLYAGRLMLNLQRPWQKTRYKEKDSGTTAEGPPDVRGDDGDGAPSTHDSRAQRGNPERAGGRAQRLGPQRSTRATSKEDGQAEVVGWRNGHVALRCALAARRPTAAPRSREGTLALWTRDVAVGEGPLRGPDRKSVV